MLVSTRTIRRKLRELAEELPSFESAWRAIYEMENYLTELEETTERPETFVRRYSIEELKELEELKAKIENSKQQAL